MDPRDYNVQNMKEDKYNEFEVLVDNIGRMTSNNSIGPSTDMPDILTSRTLGRTLRYII